MISIQHPHVNRGALTHTHSANSATVKAYTCPISQKTQTHTDTTAKHALYAK